MVPMLDAALRGGTIAVLLLLAALLLRDHRASPAARVGVAFALSVAAFAVCSAPGIVGLRTWWHAVLIALASGNAVLFWLFARALFDDGHALKPWHAALWGAFAATGLVAFFADPADAPVVSGVAGLGLALGRIVMAGLAVATTIASWRGDLVEGRRRLRGFVVGAIAAHMIVTAAADLLGGPAPAAEIGSAVNAAGLLATVLVIVWPLTRIAGEELFAPAPIDRARIDMARIDMAGTATPALSAAGSAGNRHDATLDPVAEPADPRLLDALRRLMTVDRVQRREGLTIGALALRLGVPEYRLRRLINRGLGYRNFNSFLNHYRIEETKQALGDPGQAGVPVLTIALDAGFQSLGPFNRAFKAETGLTPSEYRRLELTRVPVNVLAARQNFEFGETA